MKAPAGCYVFHGEPSRWGPGKNHLAIFVQTVGWTSACRTYPGELVDPESEITCKACIKLIEQGRP